MLCSAILDGAIICGILMLINRDESPDFWPACGCALIAAILGLATRFTLIRALELPPLVGYGAELIVTSVAVGLSFMIVFSSSFAKSALGGAIYFGIKVALILIFAFAFASVAQPG